MRYEKPVSFNVVDINEKLDQDSPLAWTKRRTGNHSRIIYINDIFLERVKQLKKDQPKIYTSDFEWKLIVVAQALSILHETGHLALRWQGLLNTCSKFKQIKAEAEAGNILENRFLGFTFSILVNRQKGERWASTQQIKGK